MTQELDNLDLVELTAHVVSAYVGNNTVVAADLPSLIGDVHESLIKAAHRSTQPVAEPLTPAVPIRKSITDDYLICLEDGLKFKSLKRHIRVKYGLSPDEYRQKWGLPYDYPMVAPNYAKARSELAKKIGLGRGQRRS